MHGASLSMRLQHNNTHLLHICTGMILLGIIMSGSGCFDSFSPLNRDLYITKDITEERLREIGSLGLEDNQVMSDAIEAQKMIVITPPHDMELTIEECRAAALENNLDLKVQLLNPTISKEGITQAEAQFESVFFSNLSWSKTDSPTASTLSGSSTESISTDFGVRVPLRTGGTLTFDLPFNSFETDNSFSTLNPAYTSDLSISLSQPLLRGAGVRTNTYSIRIATYQSQISDMQTKLEVLRVLNAVDRSYWRLYATRRTLEVRKQEYDLAVTQLERARRQVKLGVVAEVEVIRAESGVAERLESIIISENTLRNQERELKRILNIPNLAMASMTILIPTTQPNPLQYHLDTNRLINTALSNRMEMLEFELQLAIDASTIDLRQNELLPTFNFDYTYTINGLGGTLNDSIDMLIDKSFEDHRFGFRYEVPLGNQAAESRYRQALLQRIQTLASQERRELLVQQEMLNAIDQLETNWQRVLASRQNSILTARTLDAEQRQFDIGLRTSTDVLDAQARLASAQLSEISALTEYEVSKINIASAAGMLLGASHIRWDPTDPTKAELTK